MTAFIIAVAVIGAAAFAVSLYQFTVGSGCLLLDLTGIPCPSCGMTRATLCVLFGRFTAAFGYNPVFWIPYTIAGLGALSLFMKKRRRAILYCIIALLAVFIAVWIIRVAFLGWRG